MILLLMILLSLAAVYFTRLLQRNGMKTASIMVAVLYIYLIAWTYAVFILDVADLGFSEKETLVSLLHGSVVYHSFVDLNAMFSLVPLPLLVAMVVVAALVLIAGLGVALHGVVEISRAVYRFVQKNYVEFNRTIYQAIREIRQRLKFICFIRLYCRANC